MPQEKAFLGRGWSFPPVFEKVTDADNGSEGRVLMVSQEEDINQSLQVLLSTSLGERVLQPGFGCNLKDFQFEPMNASMIGLLKDLVKTAILYHEARIDLNKINITGDDSPEAVEGKLLIDIEYEIRGTNSRFNYVHPFYQNEGAGI